ncbi:hypothetical protein CC2G_011794 [Coprinopsis cinerea AmutBmut pab1-1]|nr:hypothetical protein CC2G_011794 [Coprinopsis cinerea AmutBmut pab1-1]
MEFDMLILVPVSTKALFYLLRSRGSYLSFTYVTPPRVTYAIHRSKLDFPVLQLCSDSRLTISIEQSSRSPLEDLSF